MEKKVTGIAANHSSTPKRNHGGSNEEMVEHLRSLIDLISNRHSLKRPQKCLLDNLNSLCCGRPPTIDVIQEWLIDSVASLNLDTKRTGESISCWAAFKKNTVLKIKVILTAVNSHTICEAVRKCKSVSAVLHKLHLLLFFKQFGANHDHVSGILKKLSMFRQDVEAVDKNVKALKKVNEVDFNLSVFLFYEALKFSKQALSILNHPSNYEILEESDLPHIFSYFKLINESAGYIQTIHKPIVSKVKSNIIGVKPKYTKSVSKTS